VGFPSFTVPDTAQSRINDIQTETMGYALSGYNKTRPGMSDADVLVSLKELLTDGLPSVPLLHMFKGNPRGLVGGLQDTVKDFKNLGSEYLNVIFGWKPFVNDLRKIYTLMKTVDQKVKKLAAQNGHTLRRRAILRNDMSSTTELNQSNSAYAYTYGGSGMPNTASPGLCRSTWSRTTTTAVNVWYSACYKYWIPDTTSWMWQARAHATLFGALPTPGALYAAMPWSWMVDWFTSLGDVAEALSPSAVDNLVQLYGFTMRRTLLKVACTATVDYPRKDNVVTNPFGSFGYKYDGGPPGTSSVFTDEVKSRALGFNPFGPDKTTDGLSPYQYSVLAALGLTRLG